MNNTFQHISDLSEYKTFNPTGTKFPSNITDVQAALAACAPFAQSTTTVVGSMAIATQAEVDAGTNNSKAITPATLKVRLERPEATETVFGVVRLATNTEAMAGTATAAITAKSLLHVFNTRAGTESAYGTFKISNQATAIAGTDNTLVMTPLRVKQAIANATSQIPSPSTATESRTGLVQLATVGQLQQGTIRDGFAISPYTLNQLTGNNSRKGIVQAASLTQANAGTDESVYISAKGFKTYLANLTNVGTVKLTDTVGAGNSGIALSGSAKVVPSTGGTMTGDLNVNAEIKKNGVSVTTVNDVLDNIPVGSVQMWMGNSDPAAGYWMIANGRSLNKNTYPDLFLQLGYRFGGSGDYFNIPDMRGLFVRGAGVGKDIQAETGLDEFGQPKLGNYAGGGAPGEVQTQQVKSHKHVMPWGETKREVPNPPFGGTQMSNYWGTDGYEDHDNAWMFTNDGYEVESANIRDNKTTANSKDLIGKENRPWNMSVNYIIKVK